MANPHGFTDEEMAALSDEERAALEEDESSASDTPTAEAPEADPAPAEADAASEAPAAEAPAPEDEPAAEAPAAEQPPVEEPAAEPEPEPEPVAAEPVAAEPVAAEPAAEPPPDAPRDFAEELRALDERELEVAKRFDEGEISHVEMKREEIGLRNERDTVVSARDHERARVSSEDAMWHQELKVFNADHTEYTGTDLAARTRHAALSQAIQDLSTPQNLRTRTHRWFLEEAHKQVAALFGGDKTDAPPPAKGPDDVPQNPSEVKPGETPPQTLGGVPAAADDDPSADEFSALDKLSGMELEEQLNKMSEDEADRYLDTGKLHH